MLHKFRSYLIFYNLDFKISEFLNFSLKQNYLNPIAACQTNANNKKKTGIIGNTSTIGPKII